MSLRKDFGPPNPAPLADEVRAMLAAAPPRPPLWQGTPAAARAAQLAMAASRAPGHTVATVRDEVIAGPGGPLRLRVYEPEKAVAIIVYCHGGGWVIGSIDDSDAHVRRMVAATGCTVVSVGYRLAPEHPFPAAVEDALAAFAWTGTAWLGDLPIGVAGDSAGGNIVAGATLALRDAGAALPAFQILGYPVISAHMDTRSYHDQQDGPVLSAADMRWFWDYYAPDTATRADPRAAPLMATTLAGLPPTRILTAECDPLRDEGEAFAARLKGAGVDVDCRRYPGMVHGFYRMADVLAGGREALADTAAFIRARCRTDSNDLPS